MPLCFFGTSHSSIFLLYPLVVIASLPAGAPVWANQLPLPPRGSLFTRPLARAPIFLRAPCWLTDRSCWPFGGAPLLRFTSELNGTLLKWAVDLVMVLPSGLLATTLVPFRDFTCSGLVSCGGEALLNAFLPTESSIWCSEVLTYLLLSA